MIPLTLADPATSTGKSSPTSQTTAEISETTAFGDLMTDVEVTAENLPKTSPLDADGATVEIDVDTVALAATPANAKTAEPETKLPGIPVAETTKPQQPGIEANAGLPVVAKADLGPAKALPGDAGSVVNAKAPVPVKSETPGSTAVDSKVLRSSVAQSVMEGKLPQAPPPEKQAGPTFAPSTPKAGVDGPPPPVTLPAAVPDKVALPVKGDVAKVPLALPAGEPPETRADDRANSPTLPPVSRLTTSAPAMAQPPAVALAHAAPQPLRDMTEKMSKAILSEVTMTSAPVERQGTATTVQATSVTAAAPETARQVAAQIAVAVNNTAGKATEIALNPEELGRVRLSLSAADGAIVLNVLAERPETQDLMRRNMEILAQEFRQLGYTSISFTFGDQKSEARSDDGPRDETTEIDVSDTSESPPMIAEVQTSGLDLRV